MPAQPCTQFMRCRAGLRHATGLMPNMPHTPHIDGLLGANAPNTVLPTSANDTDHDGYVEVAEG